MKLNIKATAPLVAIIDGCQTLTGGNPVIHTDSRTYAKTCRTYITCTTPDELEAIKTRSDILGFALPANAKRINGYLPALEVDVKTENAVSTAPILRTCVFGPDAGEWLKTTGWTDRVELDICYLGYSRPRFTHSRWVPTTDSLDTTQTLPIINGPDYFDLAVVKLPDWTSSIIFDDAEKILRPGGILIALADKASYFNNQAYRIASRFTALFVGAEKYKMVGTNNGGSITEPHGCPWLCLGVKKTSKQPDVPTVEFIQMVAARQDSTWVEEKHIQCCGLLPKDYPPTTINLVAKEKVYDDSTLATDKEHTVSISTPKGLGRSNKEWAHADFVIDGLKKLGKLKTAWADNFTPTYIMMVPDLATLNTIREYINQFSGWEVKVRGQRGLDVVKIESVKINNSFGTPNTAPKPSFIPSMMSGHFVENHFATQIPDLITKDEEAQATKSELVFPTEPGIANLMKLFGKLRPSVVMDADGIHHLVGGSIETNEVVVTTPGPDGYPTTITTTRKRAKLVLLPMNGPEVGDYYEAEMG